LPQHWKYFQQFQFPYQLAAATQRSQSVMTVTYLSPEAAKRVLELMNDDSPIRPPAAIKEEEENEIALGHILDSYLDHLGGRTAPNMVFHVDNDKFIDIGDSDRYKARDEGPGNKYKTSVRCFYNIEDRIVASDYFCIDNIYFEMFPLERGDGSPVNSYGYSWMNIYFSDAGFVQFIRKFREDTKWGLRDSLFHRDRAQGLVKLGVSIDEDNPPSWKVMHFHDDPDIDSAEITNDGPFDGILTDPELRGIYRGTGIFSTSFNVVMQGEDVTTLAAARDHARSDGGDIPGRLRMLLLGVRIFGREETLRKISFERQRGLRGI